MIPMADRKWYTDPIQPAQTQIVTADAETHSFDVIAFNWRFREDSRRPLEGHVVKAVSRRLEDGELFWVDETGDHFRGAQIVRPDSIRGQRPGISILDDDTFAVTPGTLSGAPTDLRWSTGKRYTEGFPVSGFLTATAAPWAYDLMPEPGDTEPVVEEKVMLAQQRWLQRYRKAGILRQGLLRNWLHLIGDLPSEYGLRGASFSTYIEGLFTIPTSSRAEVAPGTNLEGIVRQVTRRSAIRPNGGISAPVSLIGIPLATTLPGTHSTREDALATDYPTILAAVRSQTGQYGGSFQEDTRAAILTHL